MRCRLIYVDDIERGRLALAGHHLSQARAKLDAEMDKARKTALEALSSGGTEGEVARLLGVDRMTVRKWLGKR